MHPNEGALRALLDREVPSREEGELKLHLEGCLQCRGALEALRRELEEALGALTLLDVAPPVRQAHADFVRRRSRARWGPVLRRAAVLLLAGGTALSATVPGSPLRALLEERWGDAAEEGGAEPGVRVAPAPRPEAAPSAPVGVSVRPAEGGMRVVLVRPSPALRVRVRVSPGERVRVSVEGAGARFRTRPDRIEVVDGGPGEVRVEVPRTLERFSLEVDGRVYLFKEGEQLRFPESPVDTSGPEIVFEVRP